MTTKLRRITKKQREQIAAQAALVGNKGLFNELLKKREAKQ